MSQTKPKSELEIKRIVLALNSGDSCQADIEIATSLAAELQAELSALFVEDVNLIRLAALPFSTHKERHLQDESQRLYEMISRIAKSQYVHWNFSRVQGYTSIEIKRAVVPGNLLVLSREYQPPVMGDDPYEAINDIVHQACCSVLVLGQLTNRPYPVTVVVDDKESATYDLEYARMLADIRNLPIIVVIVAENEDVEHELTLLSHHLLSDFTWGVGFEYVHQYRALASKLHEQASRLLIVNDRQIEKNIDFEALLWLVRCPILVLRTMQGGSHG